MLHNPACGTPVILPFAVGTEPKKVHRCTDIYYEAVPADTSRPSWEKKKSASQKQVDQTARMNQIGNPAAKIWNKDKQRSVQPAAPHGDSSSWIDKLMQR